MEHKLHLLLLGDKIPESIQDLSSIQIKHCTNGQTGFETFIETTFQLIICQYQLSDQTAISLYDNIQSYLQLYPNSSKKDTKIIVITNNEKQEKDCKTRNLLYYPSSLDLSQLLLKIPISKPVQKKDTSKLLPINFKELFVRVDNNRPFIKNVIEKFIEVYPDRVKQLYQLIGTNDYQGTKDAAHKLKGVLANFSMEKARQTIIEVEKSALEKNSKETTEKINLLDTQIKEAIQYFKDQQELFKE
jgi:HPt (histidine-containing phosphotransfer) domain-containing protein